MDEEGQEKQVAHARRSIESADRDEQVEAAAVLFLGVCLLRGGGYDRLPRHEGKKRQGCRQTDQGHGPDDRPPGDEGQEQRDDRRKGRFPQIAGEIVDAERPPRLRPVGAGDEQGGTRVLNARPDPGQDETGAETRNPSGRAMTRYPAAATKVARAKAARGLSFAASLSAGICRPPMVP